MLSRNTLNLKLCGKKKELEKLNGLRPLGTTGTGTSGGGERYLVIDGERVADREAWCEKLEEYCRERFADEGNDLDVQARRLQALSEAAWVEVREGRGPQIGLEDALDALVP